MTDQQTSRTNITEALRALAAGWDAQAIGAGTYSASTLRRCARSLRERLAALAAEPRSDAVTAPDEPSRQRLNDEYMRGYNAASRFLDGLIAIERKAAREEARAVSASVERDPINGQPPKFPPASASVPPLDRKRLVEAINATPALDGLLHVRRVEHRHVRRFVDEVAAAYDAAAEPPARQSLECPMCGGKGRIFNITDAVNEAIAAGSAMVVPLAAETPEQGRGDEPR